MQLVAQVGAGLGADVDSFLERIAHLARPHALHEELLEPRPHRLHHDEALGRDAALSAVYEARGRTGLGRELEVGVFQDEIGVAAPELQHRLLEHAPRRGRHGAARGGGAGQGDRLHLGGFDDRGHRLRGHEERAEEAFRKTGPLHDLLDGEGAAGHVGRVLQQARVARHEPRGHEAKDLPEGEVPGHHREHHAEGNERDEAAAGVGGDGLRPQETLGLGRVVFAHPCAFLGFGPPLGEGLSHLDGHELRQCFLALAQKLGGAAQGKGPIGERRLTPGQEGLMRGRQSFGDLAPRRLGVLVDQLIIRGIDRLQGHSAVILPPGVAGIGLTEADEGTT